MTAPNDPITIPPEIAALVLSIDNLAAGFARDVGPPNVSDEDALARAAATAAIASQLAAATHATAAAGSATAANASATNATASKTAAATSSTNASNSATTAASKATASAGSVTTAATGATNAATANTNAQSYATHALALKQVSPAAAATSVANAANGSWSAAVSFTAPCNGYVFAISALNLNSPATAPFDATLSIGGNAVSTDTTGLNQRHVGYLAVTTGQSITSVINATTGSTAPGVTGSLRIVAFFIPAAT